MAINNRQDLQTAVMQRVTLASGVHNSPNPAVVLDLLAGAVLEFSRLSPRVVTGTFDGDASAYEFALSTLTTYAWVTGFSELKRVEYPADSTNRTQQPTWVDTNDLMLYPSIEAATHLRFLATTPSSGTANIKAIYTVPHTVSDTACSVSSALDIALEYIGCAHVCERYATQYGHTAGGQIDADAVDYGSKGAEWLGLAKFFRGMAKELLGVSDGTDGAGAGGTTSPPAGNYMEHDPKSIYGGDVWRTTRQR